MQNLQILPIPRLPPDIVNAINNGELAVFIGAGASMSIGCKSWKEMAESLIFTCYLTPKKSDNTQMCVNDQVREALLRMADLKKVITICYNILKDNDNEEEFFKSIRESLKTSHEDLTENIYDELPGLKGLCITSNIDTHFDNHYIKSQIVCSGFNVKDIDPLKLYHIHGSIQDTSTLVLTVGQYFQRYNRDRNFIGFLKRIFADKTVLFIGYGLTEFEVLDFLFTKSYERKLEYPKHFILLPYHSGEEAIAEIEKQYFLELGITLIPFVKDEKGWGQLYHIIHNWSQEILQDTRYLHDAFQELRIAAENYEPSIEGHILQLITTEGSLKNEFFKQLSLSSNSYPWLGPLKREGYFNPEFNPGIVNGYYYHWNVMEYLVTIAKINSKHQNPTIIQEIRDIIDPIIGFRDERGQRVENPSTDQNLVKIIFSLPEEKINDSYFEFIKTCLNSKYNPILISGEIGDKILPNVISTDSKNLLLKIVEIVIDYKKNESGVLEEYSSLMGRYYLHVILEKQLKSIIQKSSPEIIIIALKKVKEIILEDSSQFNEVWIPSIKDANDFQRYDSQIIHFIWSGITHLGPLKNQNIIISLLKEEHPIFKRIAFCDIDMNYDYHNNLFWDLTCNPLDDYRLKNEVYDLLINNCKKFSDDEIERVISWIESKKYYVSYNSTDQFERTRVIAYKKKVWLSALLPSKNVRVIELYNHYHSINPAEAHFQRYAVEVLSGAQSPITKEELLLKTNEDIVEYLNNFQEEGEGFTEISIHALWEVFRQSIIENPKKFTSDIDPFRDLKNYYQYALFTGLEDAWRNENDFEWGPIFTLIDSIIEYDEFWKETYLEEQIKNRDSIILGIASLIEEGTKKDSHILDLAFLPKAKSVLLLLDQKCESDLFDMGDLATSVLNSSKGRIFSAMINYSLCDARHHRIDLTEKWDEEIQERFQIHLHEKQSIEFFETMGKYLLNICYLDKNWVQTHINQIFPVENETLWNAAFTGYLFYSRLWIKIYTLLKKNGHYLKAIDTTFKDHNISERLIQHIVLSYFEGIENIKDQNSLINQILSQWRLEQINEIVRYVPWIVKDKKNEKLTELKSLWSELIERSQKNPDIEGNVKILSELNDWISLIDEIDEEIYEWLKISVKFIEPFCYGFINQLNRLVERNPNYIGNIFLTMTESGHIFPHEREEVRKLINMLYERKEVEIANKICATHLKHGFDFLDDIYGANLTI